MPSRWLRWAIVLFWLATTNWLFWHDLWPRWQPGEPPSLRPDAVDEVQGPTRNTIYWMVQRRREEKTQPIFQASTWVSYQPDEDTYTLHAKLDSTRDPKLQEVLVANTLKIDTITSEYRVNRVGHLRSLRAEVEATPQLKRLKQELSHFLLPLFPSRPPEEPKNNGGSEQVLLSLWGEVQDHRFFAHCRLSGTTSAKPLQFDLPPTEVSHTGSVLMPLHPLNHIRGLHRGQSWHQPLVDPLRDAFASLPGFSSGLRWLKAHVREQLEPLVVDNNETSCLVIDYTNDEDELIGHTWVELDSERVLQQEAILDDGQWIMKREFERRSGKRSFGP